MMNFLGKGTLVCASFFFFSLALQAQTDRTNTNQGTNRAPNSGQVQPGTLPTRADSLPPGTRYNTRPDSMPPGNSRRTYPNRQDTMNQGRRIYGQDTMLNRNNRQTPRGIDTSYQYRPDQYPGTQRQGLGDTLVNDRGRLYEKENTDGMNDNQQMNRDQQPDQNRSMMRQDSTGQNRKMDKTKNNNGQPKSKTKNDKPKSKSDNNKSKSNQGDRNNPVPDGTQGTNSPSPGTPSSPSTPSGGGR